MKCNDCTHHYYEKTHDGRNNRPACREKFVPYVDTHCDRFKKNQVTKEVLDYIMERF